MGRLRSGLEWNRTIVVTESRYVLRGDSEKGTHASGKAADRTFSC